jgi:hypothetical protein
MFEADTIDGFITNTINHLIETHDPSVDGLSTGAVISFYQRLKDLVWENIPFTWSRARYIGEKIVEIARDEDNGYNISYRFEELADEINRWK